MITKESILDIAGKSAQDTADIFNRGADVKKTVIYMVNEYEHPQDEIFPHYMRSYLFKNEDVARKFMADMKKANTESLGYLKYELEIENLFTSVKEAKEIV